MRGLFMKKILSTAFVATFLSTSIFANTFTISNASGVWNALVKSGAEEHGMVDTSSLKVSNLICDQEGGFVLLPMKCQFQDLNSGKFEEVSGPKAVALSNILNKSGVPFLYSRMGELSHNSLSVKKISCADIVVTHAITCTISF
jgi:hypothetical protein